MLSISRCSDPPSKLNTRSVLRPKIDTPERFTNRTKVFDNILRSRSNLGSIIPYDHQKYGRSSSIQSLKHKTHAPQENKDIFVAKEPNNRAKDIWKSNQAKEKMELSAKQGHTKTQAQSCNHTESPTGSTVTIEFHGRLNCRKNTNLFSIKLDNHSPIAEVIFKGQKKIIKKPLKARG